MLKSILFRKFVAEVLPIESDDCFALNENVPFRPPHDVKILSK